MSSKNNKDFHITLPIAEAAVVEQTAEARGAKPLHVLRDWIRLGKAAQAAGFHLLADGSLAAAAVTATAVPPTASDCQSHCQTPSPLVEQLMAQMAAMQQQLNDQQPQLNQLEQLPLLKDIQEACFVVLGCVAMDTVTQEALKQERQDLIELLEQRLAAHESTLLAKE